MRRKTGNYIEGEYYERERERERAKTVPSVTVFKDFFENSALPTLI
jgi:hypothetical protein